MSFCCISPDDPPSPDGLPPQPVELVKDSGPVASWTTASRLSKPEDAAELRALFKDGDSNIGDEEHKILEVKKSSCTLSAVKFKLRKHLSRESALSKHRLRSAVGNSEEETQRRKELRVIRDRRIQEELSSEGAYDDDAKSFSTLATDSLSYRTPWPLVVADDMDLSNARKTVLSPHLFDRKSDDGFYLREPFTPSSIKRRHSLAGLDNPQIGVGIMPGWAIRRRGSVDQMPSTPMLEPQILPSIVDLATRRTSWRLSFACDQRASQLRALSLEQRTSQPNVDSFTHNTSAGPLRWFQGHVFHVSPFAATNLSDDPTILDDSASQAKLHPDTHDYEGVDGNTESIIAPISLHNMQISQRLASRSLCSHSPSPRLSTLGSQFHYRRRSYSSDASNQKDKSGHYHNTSSSGVTDSKHSTNWGDMLRDGVSSFYPSTENSIRLTSESSRFSLPSLLAPKRGKASAPGGNSQGRLNLPIGWQLLTDVVDTYRVQQEPPNIATASTVAEVEMPNNGLEIPLSRQDRRHIIESSMHASEILSFCEQESELGMIKTRFPIPVKNLGSTIPVRSKFNEDFGEPQIPLQTALCGKPSVSLGSQLPRILRWTSRSYDGSVPFELQIPNGRQGFGYTFSNRSHSTASSVSPDARCPGTRIPNVPEIDPLQLQEDSEGIWAQALKRTQEEYQLQNKAELSPMRRERKDVLGSFLTIGSMSWKLKGKKASVDFSEEVEPGVLPIDGRDFELERELRRRARKVERERVNADEWADELEAQERKAKAKTAALGQGPSLPRPRMPLESWARFPSHTREERTASAGVNDNVSPKDFAIKDTKDGVIEWMTSDRKHHLYHHHVKEQHHSLPIRVSKQIRASLYKLRTIKSAVMSDTIHGRKSCVSIGGKLEYPELELLAGEGNELYDEVERDQAIRSAEEA